MELHHIPVVDPGQDGDLVDELVDLGIGHQLRPLDGHDTLVRQDALEDCTMSAAANHARLIVVAGCLLQLGQGKYLCAVVRVLVRGDELLKENAFVLPEVPPPRPHFDTFLPPPAKNARNRCKK
jgi:hypothetical protein